jgi:cyanophycin synthetase
MAARNLDRAIVREDKDLRGRRAGDLPRVVASAMAAEAPELDLSIIEDEMQALEFALDTAVEGEVIVSFCEQVDRVTQWLCDRGAVHLHDPAAIRYLTERKSVPA